MRKLFVSATLILIIGLLIYYKLDSIGQFRSIENHYDGSLLKKIPVEGAEDFAIDREEGLMFISSCRRRIAAENVAISSNGIYILNVRDPDASPRKLAITLDHGFNPHGISLYKTDSTARLLVVNHFNNQYNKVQHAIEIFDYEYHTEKLSHVRTDRDPLIFSPNDVVAVDEQRYYFTNDHGSKTKWGLWLEDYLGLKKGNVVYYDGNDFQIVAKEIAYANGINWDRNRDLVYVASPTQFLVKVYSIGMHGKLSFVEDVDCGTGVDNLEIDEDGKIWSGAHPRLLSFASYAKGKKQYAPSEIITIEYQGRQRHQIESIYRNDGTMMSASSVALPFRDQVYVGSVSDTHFLVLSR